MSSSLGQNPRRVTGNLCIEASQQWVPPAKQHSHATVTDGCLLRARPYIRRWDLEMTEPVVLLSGHKCVHRLTERSRPEQGQSIRPPCVVKEGFLDEVTPELSQRTNSSDLWEKGIWDRLCACESAATGNQKLPSGACGWTFVLGQGGLKTTALWWVLFTMMPVPGFSQMV